MKRLNISSIRGTKLDSCNRTRHVHHQESIKLLKRSLMNNRKRVGDRTEPCGTPLLINLGEEQWPSTTVVIERLERKLEMSIEKDRNRKM